MNQEGHEGSFESTTNRSIWGRVWGSSVVSLSLVTSIPLASIPGRTTVWIRAANEWLAAKVQLVLHGKCAETDFHM